MYACAMLLIILSLVPKKPTSFETDGLIAILTICVVGFILQLLCQQGVPAMSPVTPATNFIIIQLLVPPLKKQGQLLFVIV